jgi:Tfp pilus assembly protein PilP
MAPVLAVLVLMVLVLAAGPAGAQQQGEPPPGGTQGAGTQAGPSFKVLDVTTGSGSKSQEGVKIEVLDLAPLNPEEAAAAALAEAPPDLPPAERQALAREAALTTALTQWHNQTLADYSYDISALEDPFMPIREVRGRPEGLVGASFSDVVDTSLPPILRLELNQLKLVAITTRSGAGAGLSLASFEDGAGASYILRQGDRIGRRQGRVTNITAHAVTVEEPSPAPGAPPRVTEIRLSGTDTTGLTRLGGQVDESQAAAEFVAGQGGSPATTGR